jgi:hypothetical protein
MFWVSLAWLLLSFGWVFAQAKLQPVAIDAAYVVSTTTPDFVLQATPVEQKMYSRQLDIQSQLNMLQKQVDLLQQYLLSH